MTAGILAAVAVLLLTAPRGRLPAHSAPAQPVAPDERAFLRRVRGLLTGLTVVGGWAFLGGWSGVLAGLAAGGLAWRVLGRLESPAEARRRADLARDLPVAVHLFGASLRAGSAVAPALADVAAALPGPVADEFLHVARRLELGMDPPSAWSATADELRPLGRSMVRAHRSGASVVATVDGLAEELRSSRRHRIEALARSVEVRAAAPLGLCFLPAFVVLGVVPMVAGIFSSMSPFG
jgi:Flp pilus assembly protein TadB